MLLPKLHVGSVRNKNNYLVVRYYFLVCSMPYRSALGIGGMDNQLVESGCPPKILLIWIEAWITTILNAACRTPGCQSIRFCTYWYFTYISCIHNTNSHIHSRQIYTLQQIFNVLLGYRIHACRYSIPAAQIHIMRSLQAM